MKLYQASTVGKAWGLVDFQGLPVDQAINAVDGGVADGYARVVRDMAQRAILKPRSKLGSHATAANLYDFQSVCGGLILRDLMKSPYSSELLRKYAISLTGSDMRRAIEWLRSGETAFAFITFSSNALEKNCNAFVGQSKTDIDRAEFEHCVTFNLTKKVGAIVAADEAGYLEPDLNVPIEVG